MINSKQNHKNRRSAGFCGLYYTTKEVGMLEQVMGVVIILETPLGP